MKDAGIIHCDLKPENILLCTRQASLIPMLEISFCFTNFSFHLVSCILSVKSQLK